MAKITRVVAKVFGSNPGANQIGVFGSLSAGSPTISTDIETIQSLPAWLGGWFSAIISGNSPAIEDMNAVCFVLAYQIAYAMQTGVPEWNTDTTYYIGSLVSSSGDIYQSITDTNLGNALTSSANWVLQGNAYRTLDADTSIALTDQYIRADVTANRVFTLPTLASTPDGKKITLKNVGNANGFTATLKGNGSELIDFANTFVLNNTGGCDSITVVKTSTKWDII